MAKDENSLSDIDILYRVLCGDENEASPEFQEWLSSKQENRHLFRKLCGLEKISDSFNKKQLYDEISTILDFPSMRHRRIVKQLWVALSILVIGLSGLYFYHSKNISQSNLANVITYFRPGEKMAWLVPSDGNPINLSKSFKRQVVDGVYVTNTAGKELRFDAGGAKVKKTNQMVLFVPKGAEYEVVLCDETRIHLNSESRLTFTNQFSEQERRVELIGEAFFEVTRDGYPFIVQSGQQNVEVLGTKFNINAYPSNSYVNTTLLEGSVRIQCPYEEKEYILEPSSNFHLDLSDGSVTVSQVNPEFYVSWIHGIFLFRNQPLSEIFSQLSRWYNFKVVYERPEICDMHFSGSAEKESDISYLLGLIAKVTDIKYRIDEDTIFLY